MVLASAIQHKGCGFHFLSSQPVDQESHNEVQSGDFRWL